MNILFLASWFPYPPDNGSRQRTFHILKNLAARHSLTLIALTDAEQLPAQTEPLEPFCNTIHLYPRPAYHPRRARALAGLLSERPRSLVDTYDPVLAAWIQRIAAQNSYDVILSSQLTMAVYASALSRPMVLDEIESGSYHSAYALGHGLARARRGLTWWKYRRFVRRLAARFTIVTVVSPQERALLTAIGVPAERIAIIPNGVDCAGAAPADHYEPDTLIYTGALTFSANLDAVRFFVREILPLVQREIPRVQLTVTGRAPQVAIKELSGDNPVSFAGYVETVAPWIQKSAAAIAPLRVGGGTRLKILEAMALGTPVIATSKGAEGLDVTPGEHLLIADSPQEFAGATVSVLRDPARRARLAAAARVRVCARYDWQDITAQLDQVLTAAAHS